MTVNQAASVHQRLLNIARAEHKRFIDVLQHYGLERWLYRLSISQHSDRFVLKGGTDAFGMESAYFQTNARH